MSPQTPQDPARKFPLRSNRGGVGAILPNLAPRSFVHRRRRNRSPVRCRLFVPSVHLPSPLLPLPPSYVALLLFPAAAAEFCNDSGVGGRGAHVGIVRSHEVDEERRGKERVVRKE